MADEEEEHALPADYPDCLRKGWQRRDAWWQEQVYRRSPRLLRSPGASERTVGVVPVASC